MSAKTFANPALTVPPVSVVIVTRNRSQTLAKCLESLAHQIVTPTEVVVVDNASTDQTAVVVKKFQQQVSWPVRRAVESRIGYPRVYNRGLRSAHTDWVIFIDDDCVAAPNWLQAFQIVIRQVRSPVVALVGQSQTRQPASIWALAVLFADQLWKRNGLGVRNQIKDLETLDNKNVAYYRPFLQRHKIIFNEAALLEPGAGAAEDADLGMQLANHGGKAQYVVGAKVWHHDPDNLGWYWRRLLSGATANFWYRRRWQPIRTNLGLTQAQVKGQFRRFWPIFCREQQLSGWRATQVWLVIMLSFGWLKVFEHWLNWQAKLLPSTHQKGQYV